VTDGPFGWLSTRERERVAAGLRRSLRPREAGDALVDLASNDYLGLARHPKVAEAAADAVRTWGTGATGSRLVTGTTRAHADLEDALADFVGCEAALLFSSGYLANLGAVTALADAGTLLVSDEHNHASIVDACRLSRARVEIAPHSDPDALATLLDASREESRAVVVTDAVFSVDGDTGLAATLPVAREAGAGSIVDEAHSFGVCGPGGRGLTAALGRAADPDVVQTMTLSKSLGGQGGAVLGSRAVVDHLVDAARSFIFDTGLAPASAAAAHAALDLLRTDPTLPERARARAADLAALARSAGLTASTPSAAVVSVVLPSPDVAVAAQALCRTRRVDVGCFRPPSVPDGVSRLRLTARADLTDTDLTRVGDALVAVAELAGRA